MLAAKRLLLGEGVYTPPPSGNFTLPHINTGLRYWGHFIYVSPDGYNLFIQYTVNPVSGLQSRIIRYYLSEPFNLSSATEIQDTQMDLPPTPFSTRGMYFSDNGRRLMFLYDYQVPTTASTIIRTYELAEPWDLNYLVSPVFKSNNIESVSTVHTALRMCFSENGKYLFLLISLSAAQHLYYYELDTPFYLPTGNITPTGSTRYLSSGYITGTVTSFNIFNTSKGYSEIAIYNFTEGKHKMYEVQFDQTYPDIAPFNSNYPLNLRYTLDPFPSVIDAFSTKNKQYTFTLENNVNSPAPLFPRVAMRIN